MRRLPFGLAAALMLAALVAAGAAGQAPGRLARTSFEESHAGATSARLDYTEAPRGQFSDVRLRISRGGQLALDRALGPICEGCQPAPLGAIFRTAKSLRVLDLDGDGEPEVVVDFFWNGAHCCFYSYVAYRLAGGSYSLTRRVWGDVRYKLTRAASGDRIEFRARDPRFSYAFASFADSWWPLQLLELRAGRFVDVTRRQKGVVAEDASRIWRRYVRYRRAGREVRGVLAAYLADTYTLGQGRRGLIRVRRAIRGRCSDCTARPAGYLRKLKRFLRRTGYAR